MSLLVYLDPGQAVTRAIVAAILQSSVVIALTALAARAAFRRRAEVRHALWLGVLVWVLVSPVVAGLLQHSGFALGFVNVPLPAPTATAAGDGVVATFSPVDSRLIAAEFMAQHATGEAEAGAESQGAAGRRSTPEINARTLGASRSAGKLRHWKPGVAVARGRARRAGSHGGGL